MEQVNRTQPDVPRGTAYGAQLLARIGLWLLERAEGRTTERCRAYGGVLPDGRIRTCEKRRWHWDSHAFDVDPHAYGIDQPVRTDQD